MDCERQKLFYPEDSGYAFHIGGRLENLRESYSMDKIREFHRQFYHPDNLVGLIN